MPLNTASAADYRKGYTFGEKYFLPRAMVWAHLVVSPTSGIRVVVDQPELIADNGASYIEPSRISAAERASIVATCRAYPAHVPAGPFTLVHLVSGWHKDTISIEVEQSLLKTVSAETESQVTQALTGLANSIGILGGLEAGQLQDETVEDVHFDPADCFQRTAAELIIGDAIAAKAVPMLTLMKKAGGAKGPLADIDLAIAPPRVSFALLGYTPFRSPPGVQTIPNDCKLGVCVPQLQPASIAVSVGSRRRESAIINLPNGSEPIAIPVMRSGFADIKTGLSLDHGILTKRDVARSSEIATALALPATVVGAYLDQLASGFKKKKDALDAQVAYAKARDESKAKTEAGELTNLVLVEVPVPGLSVLGASTPGVGPLQNPAQPAAGDAQAPDTSQESPQGDGQSNPPPGKGEKPKTGSSGKGTSGGKTGGASHG